MPEPRTAVMTIVEVSWQDGHGLRQTASARMEDKSTGGACVYLKTPVGVGSRMTVQWRWEQFSGIAKYCRSEAREYRVGIQRDEAYTPLPQPVPKIAAPQEIVIPSLAPVADIRIETATPSPSPPQTKMAEITRVPPRLQTKAILSTGAPAPAAQSLPVQDTRNKASPGILPPAVAATIEPPEPQAQAVKREDSRNERKRMQRNWLGLPNRNNKGDLAASAGAESEKHDPAFAEPRPSPKPSPDSAQPNAAYVRVELLPMEEIYLAAGIVNPRKGYSINKVVDMLNSEHVRALPQEMKRAAVLMALDAAGIPIDQIQQDAKARQDALNSYEAAQKKQADAEWLRKGEENAQIQTELERVKANFMARIRRNLEEVAREKTRFSEWLDTKHQEIQKMSDAVDLCLKPVVAEPAVISHAEPKLDTSKVEANPSASKPDPIKPETAKTDPSSKPIAEAPSTALAEVNMAKAAVSGKTM